MTDSLIFSTLKFYFNSILLKLPNSSFPQTLSKETQEFDIIHKPSDIIICTAQKKERKKRV